MKRVASTLPLLVALTAVAAPPAARASGDASLEWTELLAVDRQAAFAGLSVTGDGAVWLCLDSPSGSGPIRATYALSDGSVTVEEGPVPAEGRGGLVCTETDSLGWLTRSVTMLSPEGDTVWSLPLDSVWHEEDVAFCIFPTGDGGCVAVGGPDNGGRSAGALVRPSGVVSFRFDLAIPGGPVNAVTDAVRLDDGAVVLTGVTDSLGMDLSMFTVCMEPGGMRWRVMDGPGFHSTGELLLPAPDGGVLVAGATGWEREDGFFLPPAEQDAYLMRIGPCGRVLWTSVIGRPDQQEPLAMTRTPGGDVLLLMAEHPEGEAGWTYVLLQVEPAATASDPSVEEDEP